MRERLGKHNTTVTMGSAVGLPPELIAGAVKRIGWAGAAYAICFAVIYTMFRFFVQALPGKSIAFGMLTSTAIVTGVSVWALMRSKKVSGDRKLVIGLCFEVVGALLISMSEWVLPMLPEERLRGISAVSAWVMIFGMAVPASWSRASLAAMMAAWMTGFGLLVNMWLLGVPSPLPGQLLVWMTPPMLFAGVAVVLSRLVYQLGVTVSRERDLGSYELLEKLGAGGMGEVWRARHRMLAREAAIKLIAPRALAQGSAEAMEVVRLRFEREAKATAGLRSPHTVTIFDYGMADGGTLYYVMEIVNGIDLETFIERFGPLPAGRAIWLLRQICRSLEEAHAVGLTHRDIKPRNIMVGQSGLDNDFAKVLDFGLVKAVEDVESAKLTRDGTTTGTPAYMAPEMALGTEGVDARSDLYAVGCVGYWLVTGKLVFDVKSSMGMLLAHARDIPLPASERIETPVPAELDALLLACLRKDPGERPQSARALREGLERCEASRDWDETRADRWWRDHAPEHLRLTPVA